MGNTCFKGSSAGSRYAARGGVGDDGDEYTDGYGGDGYALPQMHAGEGISGMCSGGPGIIITGGQDGSAAVWRWTKGSPGALIHRWDAHPKPVTRVAHLPGANRVLTACRDGLVRSWSPGDETTPSTEFKGHALTVSGLAALEDIGKACTGSRDYTVRLWDLETADCVQTSKISRNVVSFVRRIPGEKTVIQASEDLRLRIWDVRDFTTPAQTFEGHVNIPHCCDVSEDGNYVISSSNGFDDGAGCEVKVWDRRAGKVLREMRGHGMSTTCCAVLTSPAAAAAAAGGGAVERGRSDGGEGGGFDDLKGSGGDGGGGGGGLEGMLVVSGSTDRSVKVWNAGGVEGEECIATHRFAGKGCAF